MMHGQMQMTATRAALGSERYTDKSAGNTTARREQGYQNSKFVEGCLLHDPADTKTP